MTNFDFIYRYLKKYKTPMLAGVVFIIFATAFQMLSPWLLRFTIDYIIETQKGNNFPVPNFLKSIQFLFSNASPMRAVYIYISLIIFSTILQGMFTFLMRYSMIGASRKIENDMRNDFFRHITTLSQTFYQRNQTGDIMARATNDLEAVRSMIGPGIMHFLGPLVVSVGSITLMLKINPMLTLYALLPLPVVILAVNLLLKKIHTLFTKVQAQFSTMTSRVEENLSGIRVVKAYVREQHEQSLFKKENRQYILDNIAMARVRGLFSAQIILLFGIGILIILWTGGRAVIQNQLTIGELVAFISYFTILTWPMIALGWTLNLWQQGLASTKRMIYILNQQPDISGPEKPATDFFTISGEIEFKNVYFKYPDGPPVLKNINIKIPAGSTLAIVGATGSGKSSLVQLIPRLYDVDSGQILVDKQNIRSIPLQYLREKIGYVPQETFLFSETLEENIRFGGENLTDQAIFDASEISQLNADMDQFANGFKTTVGEYGITLSGGQKQRTAIARAVVRNPDILILDDALASVDTYTEEHILKHLKNVMKNCTSIIISHRISTVQDADHIIVLENGTIAEQGTHTALLKQHGLYYNLHKKQQLEKSLQQL
ncbi:ABC transporter ATP-binding protein [candidate division KSB1 bacterium]|nr:ABC transporter ATP-binding protein [candidate division KSB1 bacterium]